MSSSPDEFYSNKRDEAARLAKDRDILLASVRVLETVQMLTGYDPAHDLLGDELVSLKKKLKAVEDKLWHARYVGD